MKALLATNIVPARINPQRIGQYLLSDLADKQITFYRDISRLPPAHWLSLRAGHLGLERYWSLDSIREVGSRSDDCLEEEFRDRLVRSVGLRTKNTKRLGAMLSGGLDSSSIVGAASCLQAPTDPRKLETISLIFDDLADCDESKYIGAVRRKFQTQPYFIRGDQLDPFMGCGVDFWFQDEPFYTPNLFLHQAMYKLARSAGMDVLLDGFDGDVVVSHGLGYLLETLRDLRFANFFHELRALAKKWDCSAFSLVRHHILGRVTPRGVKNSLRRLRAITGKNSLASGILSPKFAKLLARTAADQSVTVVADGVQYTAQAAHVSDLEHGAIPLALEVANRASAAYGVEPRYPFFDSDFVEFCVGIPANQKLRDGWTRSILRRAMSVVLPAEVCWRRSKSDLSLNFARSMSTYGQQTIERMLARDDTPVWEFADIEVVRGSYRGLQRFSGTRDALLVWKAITLGVWLERVLGI
jgi:asparagine synthase (glutamine-hydrolysing)